MSYLPLTKNNIIISNNRPLIHKCIICKDYTLKTNFSLNKTVCNFCGIQYSSNKIIIPKINTKLKYGIILVKAWLCDDLNGLEKINIKLREYNKIVKANLYSFDIKYLNSTESNILIKFIRDMNYSFDEYMLFLKAIVYDKINICDLFLFL